MNSKIEIVQDIITNNQQFKYTHQDGLRQHLVLSPIFDPEDLKSVIPALMKFNDMLINLAIKLEPNRQHEK